MAEEKQIAGRVSVIVPTRNSAEFLGRCLASLKQQTYPDVEIIVVDNYSTDETVEIAKSVGCLVFEIGPERSSQVNLGVKNCSGEFVYRVDSDCILEPNVIEECVSLCHDGNEMIAVWCVSDPSTSFWMAVRNFERSMYINDPLVVGARFMKRTIFDLLGGFDENLVAGEDFDLHNRALRLQIKIAFSKSGEINLGDAKSLIEIILKSFRYGRQLPAFVSKNTDRGVKQLLPFRGAYVRHAYQFVRHPVLAVGFIIMQSAKYFAGAIGFLTGIATQHEPVPPTQDKSRLK